MLWLVFAGMLLGAGLVVVWPLYSRSGRHLPPALCAAAIVAIPSLALYACLGTPFPPTAQESMGSIAASLRQRVAESPGDVAAWKSLGQLYLQREDYENAVQALEKAVALEHPQNAETLVDLGAALINQDEQSISGRAGELFESAYATAPANPRVLFYSGVVAAAKGEHALAAARWETLLRQSPPPEIESMLRGSIAEWRRIVASDAAGERSPANAATTVIRVNVSLAPEAPVEFGSDAAVFVVARDPARPSPPVAAVRLEASALPRVVLLDDDDAMLPGRLPSAFSRLEIVARISDDGEPLPRAGDWFGAAVVTLDGTSAVDIVIDRRVP